MSRLLGYYDTDTIFLIISWLDLRHYGLLDLALTNVVERKLWMKCLSTVDLKNQRDFHCTHSLLRWLIQRQMRPHVINSHDILVGDPSFVGINNTFLETLAVKDCSITDRGLLVIVEGCPQLRSFEIHSALHISIGGIMALSRGCKELREITLKKMISMPDGCLSISAQGCPKLTSLAIRDSDITDAAISYLAGDYHNLERLTIEHCKKISNTGLIAIASCCPGLQSITILSCPNISNEGLTAIALRCRHLKSVRLYGSKISDTNLTDFAKNSRNLRSVEFSFCNRITSSGLSVLAAKCTQLDCIYVAMCRNINRTENIISLRKRYSRAHPDENENSSLSFFSKISWFKRGK